ncbi:MAG: hypothetical protein DME96_03355 [Verrucomicrobia bacterium]|nr:MAG: hypothetical protein DME96_03355 [Verrucomicrobiota bacterium]
MLPRVRIAHRLVSVTNTSAKGTPNITFDLQHVFFNNGEENQHPASTNIPSFFDIGQTLVPGESVHFPKPGIPALFAIQPFFTTEDVRGLEFLLQYESASETVIMVRDPSPSTFQPFCGKTALSGLQQGAL